MPITSWWCNQHKAIVPLDHFESCTYVHPDFAAAILADRELQADRTGVRVSNASACPRKSAILAAEDVAVDPLSYLTVMKGTAWHKVMEAGAGESDVWGADGGAACPLGAEISVAGEIDGIPITGTIDRVLLRDGKLIGQDHKTGKDARAVFIRGGRSYGKVIPANGTPMEYKIQLSLYAALYEQQFGRAWDEAEIWWWFSGESFRDAFPIVPVDTCLLHHPYDCEFTVGELLQQAHSAATGSVTWKDLPLAGLSIKFGSKTGCDYCDARDTCWTADPNRKAPF